MAFIAGAIIGGSIAAGASIYASNQAGKSADKALNQQEDQLAIQNRIAQEQWDLSKEQWNLYKENIWPIELEAQKLGLTAQEYATQRGGIDQKLYEDYYAPAQEKYVQQAIDGVDVEKRMRDARIATDESFNAQEGATVRNLERRGVRPGSGNYADAVGDNSLARSATQAWNVRTAVEGADNENFNRLGVALGRQPTAANPTQNPGSPGIGPGSSASLLGQAGNSFGNTANSYGRTAGMYGNAASGAASAGIQLGAQAYDTYNKYFSGGGGGVNNNPSYAAPQQTPSGGQVHPPSDVSWAWAEGGPVNVPTIGLDRQMPGSGGVVNGPPGVDQVPATLTAADGTKGPAALTDEEYVIPADVVRSVGTDPFDEIIEKARARRERAKQGPNSLSRRMH